MNAHPVVFSGAELQGPPVKVDALGRMSRRNAALALDMSEQTLANWKTKGIGPRCFIVNGRAYYNAADVLAFGRGDTQVAA